MRDDVTRIIYSVLIGFLIVVVVWVGFAFIASCGFDLTCGKALPAVERTPIPTLIAATLPVAGQGEAAAAQGNRCQIAAVDLLGAWVDAGYPEQAAFDFTDRNGVDCTATFQKDVFPLFNESNLWYPGALACTTCHNSTLSATAAQMDLSSYAGLLAGSRRASADAQGNDILGGGVWEQSLLYTQLYVKKVMPFGRPPDVPAEGPLVFAGTPK